MAKKENKKNSTGFMCAWCNGAPGIGLARIGAMDILESDIIRKHIHSAMQTTIEHVMQPRDHLCCGNMGRAEVLLTAGTRLSRPEWVEEAVKLASQTTDRSKKNGSFSLSFRHGFYNPSLFQGAVGVGYNLLRLTQQEHLPSVLLLE
jgi:lantibiotic modifying enzyme